MKTNVQPTNKLLKFIKTFETRSAFANAVGVHRSTICRMLKGNSMGSATTIYKILALSGFEFGQAFKDR